MAKSVIAVTPKNGKAAAVKAGLLDTTAKVSTTPTIDKALCDHLRVAYSNTYYADEVNNTGDAVSTLSDEYLMKIVKDQQALQPAVPITTQNVDAGADAKGVIHPVLVAMKAAETAGKVSESADVSIAGIRSSAAKVALTLGADSEFEAIMGADVDAKRVIKQSPGKLAFVLRRLFVSPTCNMIEGTGKDFDDKAFYPWPIIGTKEKDDKGNIVNNPDLENKEVAGGKMGWVSWYLEVVRMLPRGKAIHNLKMEYRKAADGDNPSGPYSDQANANYLDPQSAQKKVEECDTDLGNMVKAVKKAVELLRHMWAVDEMSKDGEPPRCTADFQMARKWDTAAKKWIVDDKAMQVTDSPIMVRDTVANEYHAFAIGEFMAHDPATAGKAGGTLQAFRKAAGKNKKRPGGTGSGQGDQGNAGAAKAPQLLTIEATSNALAQLAQTFGNAAASGNVQRFMLGSDGKDATISAWRIMESLMAAFATKPELRKIIVDAKEAGAEHVDDVVGLGRAPAKAA